MFVPLLFNTFIISLFLRSYLFNYIFLNNNNVVVNCILYKQGTNRTLWNNIFNHNEGLKQSNIVPIIRKKDINSNIQFYRKNKNTLFFLKLEKKKLPHLLCFHSENCEYCNSMEKLLKKLKEEEGVNFLKLEVQDNPYNLNLLQELDYDNLCGGLPYYYNLKTHYNICGSTTYQNLRNWALDKQCNPNEPPNDEIDL
ncbi:conserved protein, unknown function [Hepatocystis sp. ex Piliocolobus tephrosceles]|nr:conserved protein, unknown function [Hepatocystis sp. ex Piliocolobus tephrosceles]